MNAELRPMHAKTEVGIVPKDWILSTLGETCATSSGTTPARNRADRYFRNGNINWVKTLDLNNSKVLFTDELITNSAIEETCLRPYPPGTVLVAMYGGYNQIGRTGLLCISAAVNQAITAIQPRLDTILPEFLLATLNYRIGYWKSVASSSRKDPNITSKDVRAFPIAYPKVDEQLAIATALADVDALLTGLDELIAKKRNIRQATLQQLTTGKSRLPGFHEKWNSKKLGDLGGFLKGSGVRKDEAETGDLHCVRYGEIYTQHHDFIKTFHSCVTPAIAASALSLKQGDILFACSGETKAEIGKCVAFVNNIEAYAGSDIIVLRPTESNSLFLGYYLNTNSINLQKASKGQGDAVVHISASALSSINISIPGIKEQAAIADVLFNMDVLLWELEKRREKTLALKQGMMQELLTGRIRLI